QIRLRESKAGQQGRYVALSYCWGSSLPCKTTLENLETHTLGLSFDNLPNTLQDSIIVTRLLGLRFIWIDCLCIIQNDKDDWERESARMASIYSNSYLAIAATRATNCNQGILELRNRPKEPLQRRAWVFQERILAPRTLHFGSDQMFWECANDSSFEHSLPHIAEELVSGTYRRLSATKWATLVSSYTALNITYGSDRLPALAGIITKLQDLTRDVCYAGLWKRHFLSGLLWYVDNPKKPAEYRAPSWSFAALDGNISY
ncbi:HET-domain-containing protein, partial [Polyplosphaeria fusca]